MVELGEATFAETVKNIRSKVDANIIGDTISKVRETRNGNILFEILGGSDKADVVRKELKKTLRPGESVHSLEQRSLVQLRDLDCTATKQDVGEAMSRYFGVNPEDINVVSIRRVFGGEQSAVALIPRETATKMLDNGRIRVGLVYS